ncbi:MAG: histidine kinase dimerization/phospho-acceptor domain-containing protein [Ignavibacteriaceae bacterium]
MRVIKSNRIRCESFSSSLPSFTKTIGAIKPRFVQVVSTGTNQSSYENLPVLLKKISLFEKQIKNLSNAKQIVLQVNNFLNEFLPFEESDLFFFDDFRLNLVSVGETENLRTSQFINRIFTEGILDWVLKENKPQVIPDLRELSSQGSKSNYLLFPVGEGKEPKGVFTLLTKPTYKYEESIEVQLIQIILNVAVPKIELIKKDEELSSTYNELHVYQSKLSNDFKLSAIGELTSGLAEDILTPLQVILSTADFLQTGEENIGSKNLNVIIEQVKKVETVINRLVKFADLNDNRLEIKPCRLDEIITNYYNFISSSLQSAKIECILDLGENVPSILSHPDYLTHLLATIFGMIKTASREGGGILIQTKYSNGFVLVRIVTTAFLQSLKKDEIIPNDDLNIQMLTHLMNKHQGSVECDANEKTGSSIVLTFPLKKKIR